MTGLGMNGYALGNTAMLFPNSANLTTVTQSLSTDATESIVLGFCPNSYKDILLGGSATASDSVTVTIYD
ncbi:MAG TPA: hypothetical protein V6C72_13335, partial [Chroococcales cyanobacterium]